MAQLVDRLRSGSAASATGACVAIEALRAQCLFMARMGKPMKCPPLISVAARAGLIPPLVALFAKGGHAATWAGWTLSYTCTSRDIAGQLPAGCREAPSDVLADLAAGRAVFLTAGGVEAAAELLALPLRHPGLEALPTLRMALVTAFALLSELVRDFGGDRAFKVSDDHY